MDKLARLFPDAVFEKRPADVLDPDATLGAIEGCDLAASARLLRPPVHVSTFQNALNEAASGTTVNWIAKADVHREYVYVPDAMRIAAAVGAPAPRPSVRIGVCPAVARSASREAVDIAARHLGRSVKLLSVGLTTLRILGPTQ
jgi:hypothetical protein